MQNLKGEYGILPKIDKDNKIWNVVDNHNYMCHILCKKISDLN